KTFELDVHVEMVFDRVLAAPGDDDDVADAGLDGLFDPVLDHRFVDEDQHLFRLCLRGRKKPRAETSGREDGFADCSGSAHDGSWYQAKLALVIDPAFLRENPAAVRTGLEMRGGDFSRELEEIATLETRRGQLLPEVEGLKRQQNAAGDEVARAKRQGLDATKIQEQSRARNQQIKQLSVELETIELRRNRGLLNLPNIPHESVPVGKSSADNVEIHRRGTPRTFDFTPQAHWDLGQALGIIDFERGTK